MSTWAIVTVSGALWLGCLAPLPAPLAAPALVALVLAAMVAARGRTATAVAVAVLAMLLLGAALAGGRAQVREASPLVTMARAPAVRHISGRLVTEPRRTPFGRWAVLRVTTAGSQRLAARALLHLRSDDPAEVGMAVSGRMRVAALPDGGFGGHLRRLGAVAALRPVARLRTDPAPAVLRSTTTVRRRTRAVFDRALSPGHAALLSALALGVRDGLPMDGLRAAGLAHLVVVSGRHVAVLLAVVIAVTAAVGVGHRGVHRVALAAVWWFVLLTRWQPSVLRAGTLATVVLLAALHGRSRDSVHVLAATVLVLLLIDPSLARQVGFVLSVLAATGVMIAARAPAGERPHGVRLAVRATLGAQLATAPVILLTAGTVPTAAVPANLIGAPAAAIAQAIGMAAAVLAVVAPTAAVMVARLAALPLAALEWAASTFATAPPLDGRMVVGVVVVWLGVALPARRLRYAPQLRMVMGGVLIAAVGVATVAGRRPPSAPDTLRLVVADVGQGDALLVEAPDGADGARMVVDGGPEPEQLASTLRTRRIRTVDVAVLTHGDHDHAGGLARLLTRSRVGMLLVPAGDREMRDASASARAAVEAARTANVAVVEAHAGQRFRLGAARVEVLAPPAQLEDGADRNSRSIVLRVTGAGGSMLLTGDADETSQHQLLARRDLLRADVLKVPHHGGATNAVGFIDAVDASLAVVSVGADNRYGHPHPTTIDDLSRVPLWRTDRDGTVTVDLTTNGPVVTPGRPRS